MTYCTTGRRLIAYFIFIDINTFPIYFCNLYRRSQMELYFSTCGTYTNSTKLGLLLSTHGHSHRAPLKAKSRQNQNS